MSGLLLGLRRQIARNRRKDAYATRYMSKAAPIPAVASGRMKLEPENLDELEPEKENVKPVTSIISQPQEKVQGTEEKVEESVKMDEKETVDKVDSMAVEPEMSKTENTLEELKEEESQADTNTDENQEKESEIEESEVEEPEVEESEIEEPEVGETEIEEPESQEQAPDLKEPEPEIDGPKPFDFSAYQSGPKADMMSNGVKPFDFEQYRREIKETEEEPQQEKVFEEESIEEESVQEASESTPFELVRDSAPREESKEDFLLKEIDEFRERAKRLQMLLDNRETEAEKLQNIVDERQEKADALQEKADELDQILQERQKEADGITAQVERQIDALIEKVSVKMNELEASMADQNEDGRRFSEQKAKELKETLGQIQEQLTTLKTELSDKVHTENVKCFRNISDLLKGTEQKIDSMSEIETRMDEKIAPVKLLGISSLVVGIINFVAIIILMIVSMISSGALG